MDTDGEGGKEKKGKGRYGKGRAGKGVLASSIGTQFVGTLGNWQMTILATNRQADLLLRHSVNRNCHRTFEIKFWNLKLGVVWKRVWFQCEQRFTCLRNVCVCVRVCVCQSAVDCALWVVGCGCPSPDLLWPSKHTSISTLATHTNTDADTPTHTHTYKLFMAATNWPLKCYKFNAVWFFRISAACGAAFGPISHLAATDARWPIANCI